MNLKKDEGKNSVPYNFGLGGFSPFMGNFMAGGPGLMQHMMLQNQNLGEEEKQNLILNHLFSIQMQQQQIMRLLTFSAMQSDYKVNPMVFQMMGAGCGMGQCFPFGF